MKYSLDTYGDYEFRNEIGKKKTKDCWSERSKFMCHHR